VFKSGNLGSVTLGSNVSRASVSTTSDSPVRKDVISDSILIGSDDFG